MQAQLGFVGAAHTCLSEALRVSDGDILAAAVAVVDEATTMDRASLMDSRP